MAVKALMVDVDGVLIDGRPEDGLHWQSSVEEHFGFTPATLNEHFFAPHWDSIVLGRAGLMEHLATVLQTIAPHVEPAVFTSYWFEKDARLNNPLLQELAHLRATGLRVYLATNQEHLRASHIMEHLGLQDHVDGIFYSANLGVKKPDTEFFDKVQKAVGLRSDEILLIDDSRQNIEAAQHAGWHALHWTRDSSPEAIRRACA